MFPFKASSANPLKPERLLSNYQGMTVLYQEIGFFPMLIFKSLNLEYGSQLEINSLIQVSHYNTNIHDTPL